MSKPFKFRYVNEIVGGFVLLVIAALLVGVVLAGKAQGWFEPELVLNVTFPPEGSAGIKAGAEVVILGTQVGRVDEVLVRDDGGMEGVLTIKGTFVRFIRADSEAILKKKFGVAGDAFVEITRGVGAPIEDGLLPRTARVDTELVAMIQDLVAQVQSRTVPLVEQVMKMAEEYTAVATDLREKDGSLQQLLARLESIAAGLDSGRGTAGKLLTDTTTIDGVNEAIKTINAMLVELKATLAEVRRASGRLPGVMIQGQDTLQEAEVLIEGIQKHWLVRGYVEPVPELVRPDPMTLPQPGAGNSP